MPRAQASIADAVGPAAGELGQRAVVDHGPHGDAGAGAEQQEAQDDGHDDRRATIVKASCHWRLTTPRSNGVALEEARRCAGRLVGREQDDGALVHAEQEADRDDQLGHLGHVLEPADDDPLDGGAEQRGDDAEHHEQGDRRRPAPLDPQLPVDEGGQHPEGAVGEVEDARGGVGHDEAAGRDRVDGGRDEPEDRERQELVQPVEPPRSIGRAELGGVSSGSRYPTDVSRRRGGPRTTGRRRSPRRSGRSARRRRPGPGGPACTPAPRSRAGLVGGVQPATGPLA